MPLAPVLHADDLDFAKYPDGLVPAVVQDAATGELLMVGFQDRSALAETLRTGEAWFWSRSRGELWHKGATSGHVMKVVAAAVDCDADTVLLQVKPAGPACHTGERTCFHRALEAVPLARARWQTLAALEELLEERRTSPPEGSYVAKLYGDATKRHKKVGEEATELVIASLQGRREEIVAEAADLLFHTLVLLRSHGLGLDDVSAVLEQRVGAPRRE
jgi:phosphoribosyl-ATP pyrophosphohydrolase/phosphoribosyl-AMP cyclohydrolase